MASAGDFISSGIGFLGNLLGSGINDAEERGLDYQAQAARQFLNMPDYNEPLLNYNPSLYALPEEMTAETITEDPNLKAAQMTALNNMLGLTENGISAQGQRDYDIARRKAEEENSGQQEAIINNMASRGLAGGGMEFALREKAAAEAADRLAQSTQELEKQKAGTRLNALNNMITGSGLVRNQDYQTARNNQDAMNQFIQENSRRKWATNNANVDQANQAKLMNKQDIKGAYQNQYNADMSRRQNYANALNKQATGQFAQGAANRNQTNAVIGAGGKLGGAIYDYVTTPKKKTDEEEAV